VASRDLRTAIERLLDANGVQYRFLKRRGKHRSIEIQHGGRVRRLFIPNSPSDWRSVANSVAMVKRALRGAQ
jgi:hypothetical protein